MAYGRERHILQMLDQIDWCNKRVLEILTTVASRWAHSVERASDATDRVESKERALRRPRSRGGELGSNRLPRRDL